MLPESFTELVVGHVFLTLAFSPLLGHLIRALQLEVSPSRVALPQDDLAELLQVVEELQQELPKLYMVPPLGDREEATVVGHVVVYAEVELTLARSGSQGLIIPVFRFGTKKFTA